MVVPVQPLTFGLLFPGVPEVVRITDVGRRGVIALSGHGSVDVNFVLPSSLEAPGGGSIPLRFGAADAGLLPTVGGSAVSISPHEMHRIQLVADRATHLLLGGAALPARDQRQGQYTARVVIIISQPGT